MCPYFCEYCVQTDRHNTVPLAKPNDNKFTFCINYINNTNLPKYKISLIGGEPSMCDVEGIFDRFLKECPGKDFTFELITNLYKSPEFYKKLNRKYNMWYSTSFHETQTTLEEYKKRIIAISDTHVMATFVCTEDNITYAKKVYDELHDYCDTMRFVRVKGKQNNSWKYDIEQGEEYMKIFNSLQKLPKVIPYKDITKCICKNRICSGTMYQTVIRYNGNIQCSSACNIKLGNVYDNPMPLFIDRSLIPCTADDCRMCGEIHILTGREKDKCLS